MKTMTREEFEALYIRPNPWNYEGTPEDDVRTRAITRRLKHARFKLGLDLGCGEGPLTNALSEFTERMVGFDISATAAQRARQRYPHIEFGQGELLEVLARPEIQAQPFDFICLSEVLYYLQSNEERATALQGLAQLGVPHCLYYLSVIVDGHSAQRRYFTYDEFVQQVSVHFNIVDRFSSFGQLPPRLARWLKFIPSHAGKVRRLERWNDLHPPETAKHAGFLAVKR